MVAQHLAGLLDDTWKSATEPKRRKLLQRIPEYIVDAINFVTSVPEKDGQASPSSNTDT